MSKKFNIEISSFQKTSSIEHAWQENDYKALLTMIDIGEDELVGLSESELKEMCLMSLNDLEPHESAKILLTYFFKDEMTEGKIDQLSYQMVQKNLWERHAEPAWHMRFFHIYGLLRQAYNGTFALPTGVTFTLTITAQNQDSFKIFDPSPHSGIVRLLSNGLSESATLNRVFEEQIEGGKFPAAQNILWILKELSQADNERQYEITSSYFWFGTLEGINNFEANAHADS